MNEWIFRQEITLARIENLCREIELPPPAMEAVLQIAGQLETAPLQPCFEGLFSLATGGEAAKKLVEMLPKNNHGLSVLAVFLAGAVHSEDTVYRPLRIGHTIYVDTMKCFTRFATEYKMAYGMYGFNREYWAYRQLCGSLFCLGALEFEMLRFENQDRTQRIKQGEPLLSVHIPTGTQMTREALRQAYRNAGDFFAAYFPAYHYRYIFCSTWLLAPALKEMLPEGSKILNFQQDYEILWTDLEDTGYIGWVFGFVPENLQELVENTSLQRRLKPLAIAGEHIGSAGGIVVVNGVPLSWQRRI